MSTKTVIRNTLDSILQRFGYKIVDKNLLYDWQIDNALVSQYRVELPTDALSWLTPTNPRLKQLQSDYAAFNSSVTTPLVWDENQITEEEIQYFRGENAYVWQRRGMGNSELNYLLSTYYIKSIDKLGLLDKLHEDGAFGTVVFEADDKIISRDLLDSVNELNFLDRHIKELSNTKFNIIDIGAGYGRLAYRAIKSFPNIEHYFCTDGVPYSTFISEYYLKYRGVDNRAQVIPLYEIEEKLSKQEINLAINIHSFSECRLDAIEWWVKLLQKNQIKYLFIIPNEVAEGWVPLYTNDGLDFSHIIHSHGYKLIAKEPKYLDKNVQKYGIYSSNYHLFQLHE